MTRFLDNPVAPLATILAALVLVLGVAQITRPDEHAHAAGPEMTRAPVESALKVCPEPSLARVSLATPPGDSGGDTEGDSAGDSAEIETLGRDRVDRVQKRGQVWVHDFGDKAEPLVVRASGDLAAGLEVEQTSVTSGGVSGVRCVSPTTGSWFLGDAVDFGRTTKLSLTDVDDTAASVNVDVYGQQGLITAMGSRGITVQPHRQKVIGLDTFAGDTRVAAIHVSTTMGRVAAAIHTRSSGGDWSGTDWLPPTQPPAREQVIPGLPKGHGDRRLLIVAPGDVDATAKIRLVTGEGTYAPRSQRGVDVPADSVESVSLGDELNGRAAAVRISSSVPVTAAVTLSDGKDLAYVPAAPPLDQSAVVSGNRSGNGATSTLLLSAPRDKARVRVTTIGRDGTNGKSTIVKVPGSRTDSTTLTRPPHTSGTFGAIVTPLDGSVVYGARMISVGDRASRRMTVLPLRPSPTSVSQPNAESSLAAAVPSTQH
ncbi:MAG: DUF5719 family protein [Streptosporangiaceae bacterium]